MAIRGVGLCSLQILITVVLSGCQTNLMPTPVSYYGGNADPLAAVPEADQGTSCEIFVFTNRALSEETEADPEEFYTNERSREGRLAIATVEFDEDLNWDTLHQELIAEDRDHDPVPRLTKVEDLGPLWITTPPEPARLVRKPEAEPAAKEPADRFLSLVNARLAASRSKRITILLHGYNTEFGPNQVVAAGIHHYLGRDGVFVTYAWPSRGTLLGYGADKANAAYSVRMFRQFLRFLAEHTSAHRINLIAHSAGGPIAVEAVRDLRLMHYEEDAATVAARYRIGEFVLVAPDVDLYMFVNAELDGLEDIPDRVTIYVSTVDRALSFSGMLFSFARLGEPLQALTVEDIAAARLHPKLDVVDVTDAEDHAGSFLGHSYFHEDPWVSADLLLLLRHGIRASERGLIRNDVEMQWRFPEDYPEVVRQIAADLARTEGEAK